MPIRTEQTSFVSGEIAGELDARRDTQHYHSALARARNITAIPQGGFMRREGTRYVATMTDESGTAPTAGIRVIPFEFSVDETYLVVLTQQKLEVRDSDGAVVTTFTDDQPYGLLYNAADVGDVNYVQALDTMFLVHPDKQMLVLQRFDSTDWRLNAFAWVKEDVNADGDPGLMQPYHKFADGDVTMQVNVVTAVATGVIATASEGVFNGGHLTSRMRIFDLADQTQYLESEIDTLPGLVLTGTTVNINDGVLPDQWNIFVDCVDATYNREVYIGDYVYLTVDGQTTGSAGSKTRIASRVASVNSATQLQLAEVYPGTTDSASGTLEIVQSGTASALTGTITFTNESTAVTGGSTAKFTTEINIGDRVYLNADGQKKATKVLSIESDTALTLDRNYGGTGGAGASSVVTKQGTTTATVNNRIKVGTPNAGQPKTSWAEAAMSEARGYARAITLHQNRLVVCGTRDLPDTCFFSKTGLYFRYEEGTALADESFSLTMTSNQINDIQQAISQADLIIGTLAQSFTEENVPITPDTAGVSAGPSVGWANIVPVSLEGAVVYVSDGRGSIRQRIVELVYDDAVQAYTATDISLLAFHLINTPVRMASRSGDSQTTADNVFVVNSGQNTDEDIDADGSLAVLNTIRSQQITGWTLWETDGEFLDVAIIDNTVWFAIQRTINGTDFVYLEKLTTAAVTDSSLETTPGTALTGTVTFTTDSAAVTGSGTLFSSELAVNDWIILNADGVVHRAQVSAIASDTALTLMETYTGSAAAAGAATKLATTISGLTHLEAEVVDLVADGEYLGQYTVASGAITPERPVNAVEVGLPYSWSVVTLPQNRDNQGGVTTNAKRRLVQADINLLRATEMRVRRYGDTGAGTRVDFSVEGTTTFGSESAAFTGTKRVHLMGWTRTGQIELFGQEPRATHVRSVTWEVA